METHLGPLDRLEGVALLLKGPQDAPMTAREPDEHLVRAAAAAALATATGSAVGTQTRAEALVVDQEAPLGRAGLTGGR